MDKNKSTENGQELRAKYEAIAKSVVKKREQKLTEQFKHEVEEISEEAKRQQKLMAATWHSQVASLQQELEQQKKVTQESIDKAMDAGRVIGQNQVEEKCAQLIHEQEEHSKREYNNFLVQQQNLKTQIAKECLTNSKCCCHLCAYSSRN